MIKFEVGEIRWAFLIVIEVEPGGVPVNMMREMWPFLIALLRGPHGDSFSFTNFFNEISSRAIDRVIFPFEKEVGVV